MLNAVEQRQLSVIMYASESIKSEKTKQFDIAHLRVEQAPEARHRRAFARLTAKCKLSARHRGPRSRCLFECSR